MSLTFNGAHLVIAEAARKWVASRPKGGVAARWPNTCSECGERWHGPRPGETVCTDCWLVHPDGACDR